MIENKFKKAIYAEDLDFSVERYKEWDNEWYNDCIAVTFSSLENQYQELQDAYGIDKDGNVVENDYMEIDVSKELVSYINFAKKTKLMWLFCNYWQLSKKY